MTGARLVRSERLTTRERPVRGERLVRGARLVARARSVGGARLNGARFVRAVRLAWTRYSRLTRTALSATLAAIVAVAPLEAQASGGEPPRVLVGAAAGGGVGGLLAGVLSTETLAVDVAGYLGVRVRPRIVVVAEVGALPKSLPSPFDERELRPWRVMLGVQEATGAWFRPALGWEQGAWRNGEGEEPGEGSDDSAGGPVLGITLGDDLLELGARWGLGLEVFGRWAWLDTDPSSSLRVLGVRGVLLRR